MRALISVSNKEGIVEFAKGLASLGVEIISTGGTLKALEDNNCLLILPIGLHQEINNSARDVEDLVETIDEINNNLDGNTDDGTDAILDIIDEAIRDSKEKCFSCYRAYNRKTGQ